MKILLNERMLFMKKDIEELGIPVVLEPQDDVTMLVSYVDGINENLTLPNLKYIQVASSGYNSLNLEVMKERGIKLMNGRGLYSIEIAEYIVSYILAIYKKHRLFNAQQEKHVWERHRALRSLEDAKILCMGTGSIAQEAAKRLKPFGVHLIGLNSNGRNVEGFDETAPLSSLDAILGDADIVIGALPENEATLKLMNASRFKSMKADSVFINIGRGTLVDTHNLAESIAHLSGVVFDVFDPEPMPEESPLWDLDNVYITGHISAGSQLNQKRTKDLVLLNIKNILEGNPLHNEII